jgi:LysM repeat protein
MALNTAHFHLPHKLNLLPLALIAIFFALWPRGVMAQDPTQQVLNSINAARAENGLAPLAMNPLLNQAAQNHVDDMITNYVYGHYGSDGSTVQIRVARTGYSSTPWVSENWVSASDASGAMRWWMNDYIHRVNILTGRWTEIGIGVGSRGSEMIFVTVFSAGGGSGDAGAAIAASPPPQEAPPPPSVRIEQVSVPAEGLDYTVQGGDTLLAIGLRYGLPWERIAQANGLDERSLLQIGQTILIPGSGTPAAPPPEVKTEDYVIQPNDTLYSIAAKRGMYWDDVASVNGFNEQTLLQIGQVIQVPVVEEQAPPTPLVELRRDGVGPVPVDQSADSFDSYTLMKFDPTNPVAMTSMGTSQPVSEVQQVAMAKSADSESVATQPNAVETNAVETEVVAAAAQAGVTETEVTETEVTETEVTETEVTETSEEPALYVVQPGDTIISIAVKNDLEWGPLLALNGLTESSVLQLGQMIRLR